jgi:O-antigen ligase
LNLTYQHEQRLNQLFNYSQDKSFQNRRDEFEQAGKLFLSSPMTGVGYGYQYNFYRFITGKGYGWLDTNYTHNDLMNILAKGGLIGMLLFYLFFASLLRLFSHRRQALPGTMQSTWATIGIITIILSIFMGLSTPVLQTRDAAFIMAVMLGLCITNSEPERDEHTD